MARPRHTLRWVLLTLVIIAVGVAPIVAGVVVIRTLTVPSEDQAYFCAGSDASPLPSLASARVLQMCDAGKTAAIKRGEIIAVDLVASYGVDEGTVWSRLTVSDPSVLSTVAAPSIVKDRPRFDDVAIYRGARAGATLVTALFQRCGIRGCDAGYLWKVTVQVT